VRGVVSVVEQDLAGAVGALDCVENFATLGHVPVVSYAEEGTYVVIGFSVSTLMPFSRAGMMY
jgi:hypothetical protein